jgi:two-component system, chemotaxis family, sensor histidine kinase and response regulator PixL
MLAYDPEIRDQAYQFFVQEASEFLQTLESGLLNLRQDFEVAKVHEVMRAAHSIKGGAASVGLEAIQAIAHRLEDVLRGLYKVEDGIDETVEGLLLQGFDCLQQPLQQEIDNGFHDGEQWVERAVPIFAELEALLGDAMDESALPSAAELGFDIVQMIFSGDVSVGIERLETVLANPDAAEIAGEVRAQADVFVGVGELVNLPGFVEIARATLAALDTNPAAALQIGRQALACFQAAKVSVEGGDRTQGGSPSPELLAFNALPGLASEEETLPKLDAMSLANVGLVDLGIMDTGLLEEAFEEAGFSDLPLAGVDMQDFAIASSDDLEDMFGGDLGGSFGDALEDGLGDSMGDSMGDSLGDSLGKSLGGALPFYLGGMPSAGVGESVDRLESQPAALPVELATPVEPELAENLQQPLGLEDPWSNQALSEHSDDLEHDIAAGLTATFSGATFSGGVFAETGDSEAMFSEAESPLSGQLAGHFDVTLGEDFADTVVQGITPGFEVSPESLPDFADTVVQGLSPEVPDPAPEAFEAGRSLGSDLPADQVIWAEVEANHREIETHPTGDLAPNLIDDLVNSDDLEAIFGDTLGAGLPLGDGSMQSPIAVSDPARSNSNPLAPNSSDPTPSDSTRSAQTSTSESSAESSANLRTDLGTYAKAPALQSKPLAANTTLKIDLQRIDRLNNRIGELVTQENSAILQVRQLSGVVTNIQQRFGQFERIHQALQTWTDRNLSDRIRLGQSASPVMSKAASDKDPTNLPSGLTTSLVDFDALQFDSYTPVFTLTQEIIEELAQLGESVQDLNQMIQQAQQIQRKKMNTLKQAQNDLLWARMLPVGDILQRFPRMVRDLSSKYKKPVQVRLVGTSTLVDKAVLEKLYDPLVHLVRNAFDHGIESPEQRQAESKPAEATIEIRAYHRGNQTYLEVRDDGKGIDPEVIRNKAIEKGLMSPEEAAQLSTEELYLFLFVPNFSTASQVSELSGRGVGLDSVRANLKRLKGEITLQSKIGKGTTFVMRLPLTLTIANLLVFKLQSRLMAVSMDTLVSILTVTPDEIETLQGQRFYRWDDQLIPICPPNVFAQHYPLPTNEYELLPNVTLPQSNNKIPLIVVSGASEVIALQIEQIIQEQELVIKPFGKMVPAPNYIYGCTVLGDGTLVPVLDGQALITHRQLINSQVDLDPQQPNTVALPEQTAATKILVVDDSLTTRNSLAAMLKKAGYMPIPAKDGRDALERLEQMSDIRAIFCDMEMPRMNGLEFLTHCRKDYSKQALPVIMLTSRSSEKHRQIATHLGANDYLTKPFLEEKVRQTLLDVLRAKV